MDLTTPYALHSAMPGPAVAGIVRCRDAPRARGERKLATLAILSESGRLARARGTPASLSVHREQIPVHLARARGEPVYRCYK